MKSQKQQILQSKHKSQKQQINLSKQKSQIKQKQQQHQKQQKQNKQLLQNNYQSLQKQQNQQLKQQQHQQQLQEHKSQQQQPQQQQHHQQQQYQQQQQQQQNQQYQQPHQQQQPKQDYNHQPSQQQQPPIKQLINQIDNQSYPIIINDPSQKQSSHPQKIQIYSHHDSNFQQNQFIQQQISPNKQSLNQFIQQHQQNTPRSLAYQAIINQCKSQFSFLSQKKQKYTNKYSSLKYPKQIQIGSTNTLSFKWNHHAFISKIKQVQVMPHPNGNIKCINFRYEKGQPPKLQQGHYASFVCQQNRDQFIKKLQAGFKAGILQYIRVTTNKNREASFCKHDLADQCEKIVFGLKQYQYPAAFFGESLNQCIIKIGCILQTFK